MKGKGSKTLNCRECNEPVNNVGIDSTAVTCWKCVSKSLRGNVVTKDEEESDDKDKKHSTASE